MLEESKMWDIVQDSWGRKVIDVEFCFSRQGNCSKFRTKEE